MRGLDILRIMDAPSEQEPLIRHLHLSKLGNDSPSKNKFLGQSCPPHLGTDDKRDRALKDLQERVPEIELSRFLRLLPKLRKDIIRPTTVIKNLKNAKFLTQQGRWTGYSRDPIQMRGHEDHVFSRFADIAEAIVNATGKAPTLKFVCNPRGTPMSSTRDNTSKPDSYGVLAQSDPAAPEWINIVVPGEFKKGETEEDVNDVSHCWSSEI